MQDPSPDTIRIRETPCLTGAAALALVLLCLAASRITPVMLQRRIDPLQAEVDTGADPARALETGVQLSLARQMSALRGTLITGDSLFLATYTEASRQEHASHRRLEPLARGLDHDVFGRIVVMQSEGPSSSTPADSPPGAGGGAPQVPSAEAGAGGRNA